MVLIGHIGHFLLLLLRGKKEQHRIVGHQFLVQHAGSATRLTSWKLLKVDLSENPEPQQINKANDDR